MVSQPGVWNFYLLRNVTFLWTQIWNQWHSMTRMVDLGMILLQVTNEQVSYGTHTGMSLPSVVILGKFLALYRAQQSKTKK